jgi:hypothetical protein
MRGLWISALPCDCGANKNVYALSEPAFATVFVPAGDITRVSGAAHSTAVFARTGRVYHLQAPIGAVMTVLHGESPSGRRWPRPQATDLVLPAA